MKHKKDFCDAALSSNASRGGNHLSQKRVRLLQSEIDFGFTLIAVARTRSAVGDLAESSMAIQQAESTLMAVRKCLAGTDIPPNQRASARERVEILEEILASMEAARAAVIDDAQACGRYIERESVCKNGPRLTEEGSRR